MRRHFHYLLVTLFTFALGFTLHSWRRRQGEAPASALRVVVAQKQPDAAAAQAQDDSEIERKLFDPSWVYVTKDIRWKRLPKGYQMVGGTSENINGRLVVFYPSGAYAEVSATLVRDEKGKVKLVENAEMGYVTFVGTWKREADGTISTTARYSHTFMYGMYSPEAPQVYTRRWVVVRPAPDRIGALIKTGGEKFVPASEIQWLDGLPSMVRDWEKDLHDQ